MTIKLAEVDVAKRLVCIGFDVDAVSGFISRGLTTATPMFPFKSNST